MNWSDTEILITGGTGSLGRTLVRLLLDPECTSKVRGVRIYGRDELKQWELRRELERDGLLDRVSFLIGDVRDKDRLRRAVEGVNVIIHTAALKQVPSCEGNPLEAVKTNVLGAANVVDAAVDCGVDAVMNVSTDKAVNPVNLYGATKLCAEKVFLNANVYSKGRGLQRKPRFSCCRYGNVVGSRGSVIPLFFKQMEEQGQITVTDFNMTRFLIEIETVARFLLNQIGEMKGGEIFIPRMRTASMLDIALGLFPGIDLKTEAKEIGIRPGEKLHEVLISREEIALHDVAETPNCFVILPPDSPTSAWPKGGASHVKFKEYGSRSLQDRFTLEEINEIGLTVQAKMRKEKTK